MIGEFPLRDTRERQILRKAIDAFAAHGVRGTSLRDIAQDANVSLALISHHFGNKTSLVAAAIEQIRLTCTPALSRLRARLERLPGSDAAPLVEAWVDYLEDAFGSEETRPHLRLLHRLRMDPSVERSVCASLDIAESWLRRALKTAFPRAGDASIDLVLKASHAMLVTTLLEDVTDRAGEVPRDAARRALLIGYVGAAIDATLGEPRPHAAQRKPGREQAPVSAQAVG